MTTLTTKHQRLAALRPLSPESVASLAAAWYVRMVPTSDHDIRTLDCGSLLPLSVMQPAANRHGQQAGSRKSAAGCTQSMFPNLAQFLTQQPDHELDEWLTALATSSSTDH